MFFLTHDQLVWFYLVFAIWIAVSAILRYISPKFIFATKRGKKLDTSFINYQQEWMYNQKGQKIDCWWLPKQDTEEVILYLHGAVSRVRHIVLELQKKSSVFSPAYPGFNLSEGKPSIKGFEETADLALRELFNKGYKPEQIVVWGHSLGGYPALYLATKYENLKSVVLVNTLYSFFSVMQRKKLVLLFFRNWFNLAKLAAESKSKIIQFGCPEDTVLPYQESLKLFEKIASPNKQFYSISGGHSANDTSGFNVLETFRW